MVFVFKKDDKVGISGRHSAPISINKFQVDCGFNVVGMTVENVASLCGCSESDVFYEIHSDTTFPRWLENKGEVYRQDSDDRLFRLFINGRQRKTRKRDWPTYKVITETEAARLLAIALAKHQTFFESSTVSGQVKAEHTGNKYHRKISSVVDSSEGTVVDVYCVIEAYDVRCPARQHALKKLLCSGIRGKGDSVQDLIEARDAVERAIMLERQRKKAGN